MNTEQVGGQRLLPIENNDQRGGPLTVTLLSLWEIPDFEEIDSDPLVNGLEVCVAAAAAGELELEDAEDEDAPGVGS